MNTEQLLEEIRKHFEKSVKYEMMQLDAKEAEICSFCNKSRNEVRVLISGPRAYICDECVELCMEIVQEKIYGNE